MCGGCDKMFFHFSNLLYMFEKVVAWCVMCSVVTCIIITTLVSLGLGVGVGYNYSIISMKTRQIDSDDTGSARKSLIPNDSSDGEPTVPKSSSRFGTQNVNDSHVAFERQNDSGQQNEKIVPIRRRISSRKVMPSRTTEFTEIYIKTTVTDSSGLPVTSGWPSQSLLPSKLQTPVLLERTDRTRLSSSVENLDNLGLLDTSKRIVSGEVLKDSSTITSDAELFTNPVINASDLKDEPATEPTRTATKTRKLYDNYRPWWRKISRRKDVTPSHTFLKDPNSDSINSESHVEDSETRKADSKSLKPSRETVKEATIIVPLNKSLNILPLISKILGQKENITLQFIKMR